MQPDELVDHDRHGGCLGRQLCQQEPTALEGSDRLAECLAIRGVLHRLFEDGLHAGADRYRYPLLGRFCMRYAKPCPSYNNRVLAKVVVPSAAVLRGHPYAEESLLARFEPDVGSTILSFRHCARKGATKRVRKLRYDSRKRSCSGTNSVLVLIRPWMRQAMPAAATLTGRSTLGRWVSAAVAVAPICRSAAANTPLPTVSLRI
jgi:hypothetical protein